MSFCFCLQIMTLVDDAIHAMPTDILTWPISVIGDLPQQENGHDCGVFVCKYMEFVLRCKPIDWTKYHDWQAKMHRFRAEIAYNIIEAFYDLIKTKIE